MVRREMRISMGPTRRRTLVMGWAALGAVACAAASDERAESTDSVAVVAPAPVTDIPVTDIAAGEVSAASGVFTAAQAARGREVYTNACARCHVTTQHSGATFAATWNNRRVFDLYDILYNTMPLDDPGSLSEQEYADVVAYILQLNGHPAGKGQLPTDPASLRKLRIDMGAADEP